MLKSTSHPNTRDGALYYLKNSESVTRRGTYPMCSRRQLLSTGNITVSRVWCDMMAVSSMYCHNSDTLAVYVRHALVWICVCGHISPLHPFNTDIWPPLCLGSQLTAAGLRIARFWRMAQILVLIAGILEKWRRYQPTI